ncbi:MAG TPA: Ig-like domain-containing protein [Candidatus Acidoferrum sp.]|nr:Ig-like domain-containing protein [Candidatus Acidoferrum sp.]
MTQKLWNGPAVAFGKGLPTAMMIVLGSASVCSPQATAFLQITSPSPGTVVKPGQKITVSISSPSNATFSQAIVLGDDGIGGSSLVASVPAQVSLTIPTKTGLGPHALTASGATSNQVVFSFPVVVDVERTDLPQALSPSMSTLIFSAQGDQFPLDVDATFSDGSYLDARASSYISYASSNTSVATVDAKGIVTSVAQGSATVTATYTLGGQSVQVSVPVSVPPAILTASPGSLNFGTQTVGTTSAMQQITLTNVSSQQVNIGTIEIPSVFPETDNCASTTLAPGGTCTLNIAFAPAAGVRANSWLRVHNDGTAVAPSFALTGAGTPSACVSTLNGRGTPGSGGGSTPRIDVSWSTQSGASSYDVLRTTMSGSPYYVLLGNVTSPAYSDRGGILTNGSTYYYVVRPVGSIGEICPSNEASVTIPNP